MQNGASALALANYSISGGAVAHINGLSLSFLNFANRSVELRDAPHFSAAFCIADSAAVVWTHNMTFSGSATGTRYVSIGGGIIYTNAGGPTYLPGTGTGITSTQGQYL